jgi:hypothetical protein
MSKFRRSHDYEWSVDEEPVVPAREPREILRRRGVNADGFIVDFRLVPIAAGAAARKNLAPMRRAARKSVWVRPNASDTPHFREDLAAICKPGVSDCCCRRLRPLRPCEVDDGGYWSAPRLLLARQDHPDDRERLASAVVRPPTRSIARIALRGARDGDLMTDLGCGWSNWRHLERSRVPLITARAAYARRLMEFADVKDQAGFEQDTRLSRMWVAGGRHTRRRSSRQPAFIFGSGEIAESRRHEAFDEAVAKGHASVLFEGR